LLATQQRENGYDSRACSELQRNAMNEDFNQRQRFILAALPSEWLGYAEDLADAAEALWDRRDEGQRVGAQQESDGLTHISQETAHARSYILLAGLALENALKAYLVALDPYLINRGALDRSLHTHSLTTLASRLPISLTSEETVVLETCQDAIPYWGRYPIPLHYRHLSPANAASTSFREIFRQLHHRLCREVHTLVRDGWDSGAGPKTVKSRSARYGDAIDHSESFFE
jgi:hypothetical protein